MLLTAAERAVPVATSPFDTPRAAAKRRARRALAMAALVRDARIDNGHDLVEPLLRSLTATQGLAEEAMTGPRVAGIALGVLEEVLRDAARVESGELHFMPDADGDRALPAAITVAPTGPMHSTGDDLLPLGVPAASAVMAAPLGSIGAQLAPRLSEQVDNFLLKLPKTRHAKRKRDIDVARRHFVSLLSDVRLDELSFVEVTAFREAALAIPKFNGKGIYAGLETAQQVLLADAIDMGDVEEVRAFLPKATEARVQEAMGTAPVPRSTMKVVNKHLSMLQMAIRPWYNAHRTKDRQRDWTPILGEFFSKKEAAKGITILRTALSDDEISAVFQTPLYTGHGGDRLRTMPGTELARDAFWWVPLIGLHAGARLEEILQLRPAHIEMVEGVAVVAFGRDLGTSVKTPGSRRRTAIHPFLIELDQMSV